MLDSNANSTRHKVLHTLLRNHRCTVIELAEAVDINPISVRHHISKLQADGLVASDEERSKVIREASRPQFQSLKTRFFPYSAVEELYSLCQRRKLRGITEEFLDSFMEPAYKSD